jgi:hypothetical protein
MPSNDNQHRRICDDREVARIATRCLEMLVAPDERMFFEQAMDRWGWAQFAMNEVFANEQSTVEQTVVALWVMASWQRYWSKYHHKPKERHRCLDAWLNTYEVPEQHERRNNVGI